MDVCRLFFVSNWLTFRPRTEQLTNCTIFLTLWMASIGSRGIFHIGLIFCRDNHQKKIRHFLRKSNHIYIFRYIYVRYATGLLEDGISLLHWATLIFISFFCIHIMLIHPMRWSSLSLCLFIWFKSTSEHSGFHWTENPILSHLILVLSQFLNFNLMQIYQKWETLPGFS